MTSALEAKIPEIEHKCNLNSDNLKEQLKTLEDSLPARDEKADEHQKKLENHNLRGDDHDARIKFLEEEGLRK
jgi:hypothetical protein